MTENDFFVAIQGILLEQLERSEWGARRVYDKADEAIAEFFEEYVGYSDD